MDDSLQTTVNSEEGRRHSNANIDMKLEAIVTPVSDVDHAREFYTRLGGGSTPTTPAVTDFA